MHNIRQLFENTVDNTGNNIFVNKVQKIKSWNTKNLMVFFHNHMLKNPRK